MGSRVSKANAAATNIITFVDPVSALKGQPFIQPSNQKKPPVPLVDEPEPQVYNLFNLIERPPSLGLFQQSFFSPLHLANGALPPIFLNPLLNFLAQKQFMPALPFNSQFPSALPFNPRGFPLANDVNQTFLNNRPLAMPYFGQPPLIQPIVF